MIPFNKIHLTGNEIPNISKAIESGHISGDGFYTRACESFFEQRYGFARALLTASCTDALELSALLINLQAGDEVIVPSYSFVSTANAFLLRGAKVIFADSCAEDPNMDPVRTEKLISTRTKAIVVIHYAGIACQIEAFRDLADRYGLILIEDAAQAADSYYRSKPLGSFGHLAAFSFHETKNITCGEGGLLAINDPILVDRAEIIREKGTNRSSFLKKEVSRYQWMEVGSSYLPPELSAAFLYAQVQEIDQLTQKRREIWETYYRGLQSLQQSGILTLPIVPLAVQHNAHTFYLICPAKSLRDDYISFMMSNEVEVKSHYMALHDSPFYKKVNGERNLTFSSGFQDKLVRLPLFCDLSAVEVEKIITLTLEFFAT